MLNIIWLACKSRVCRWTMNQAWTEVGAKKKKELFGLQAGVSLPRFSPKLLLMGTPNEGVHCSSEEMFLKRACRACSAVQHFNPKVLLMFTDRRLVQKMGWETNRAVIQEKEAAGNSIT